jgi:aromatic-L-amino-acid decarboxylase
VTVPSPGPLALDAETAAALGHRVVAFLGEALAEDRRCVRRATPSEMAARAAGGPPERSQALEELLSTLREHVLPYTASSNHPGYMAFVPGSSTFVSALGDFIASALNVYAGTWMEGAGPSQLELVVLDWFKDWIGYPPTAAGSLVSGGSAANLTALICARESRRGEVIYVSDQGHASIIRAARVAGLRVHVLESDGSQRLAPEAVASAIADDRAAGRIPLLVAAAAGATNTGAVDPLADLADVCRANGVWLHVDAAYGGFAALTERGRRALAGIGRADSVTLDPHKWLHQPYECGCLLVRDGALLERAFKVAPPYLADAAASNGEVDFGNLGLQMTRRWRALPVWLSINFFGVAAFRAAIDQSLDLAERARDRIAADPRLESIARGELATTCFRRRTPGSEPFAARVNADLVSSYEASGRGLVASTWVGGRYAVRACPISHTTTAADVDYMLEHFAAHDLSPSVSNSAAARAASAVSPASAARS